MDTYALVRGLPFPVVAPAIGIDVSKLKTRHKAGTVEWYGGCPIHGSKSEGSTCFSYRDDGIFHCFNCGAKGKGAIDLTKLVQKVGFQAAVAVLQPLVGQVPAHVENAPLRAESRHTEPLKSTYHKYFQPCPWLAERIRSPEVLDRYGVGYYDNPARRSVCSKKVLLPARGFDDGLVYGYLARAIDGAEPKYAFPAGFPKHRYLFGAWELGQAQPLPLPCLYVLESPLAVLSFACRGLPAVSPFGWHVSPEQARLLRQLARSAVYLPDADKRDQAAGLIATLSESLFLRAPRLPKGVPDPEYLTDRQLIELTVP